ncbi:MAG: HTH-type transcriptional regulator LutR [Syntrophorhabdus sp. PtaU1.Bin153]|nr:MAG: HTH-type transcriptional regulator LutR [Syntrophorhabdus sp. PtaU1.Bin153]
MLDGVNRSCYMSFSKFLSKDGDWCKMKPVFEEVTRGRLSDNLVHQIKNSIVNGIYKPGEKLPPEKELLEIFNVSRGTLREALKSLERLGFVVVKTGVLGGAYVTDRAIRSFSKTLYDVFRMNKVSFHELLEVREIIEPGIAALAAERRTEADIKQLEDVIALREKSIKADKIPIVVNIDWHQAVAEASKNQMLCLIIDATAMILNDEFKKISLSLKDHRAILEFHKKVTACIKAKDSKGASTLMQEHIIDVSKRLKN